MTPERVEEIYNELVTLVIELDADPTSKGPAYLQDLISKTRGYLNRTSLLLQEVYREQHGLERQLNAFETAFQASSDELLADDARVTRLPNIDDRKAMINLLLRDERARISELKRQIKDLGFVEKAVKHRHRELDNTTSSIRMQKSLIDTEIRTGAVYGDETDTSRGTAYAGISDIDEAELARLLDGGSEAPAPTPTEAPTVVEEITLLEEPQDVGVSAEEQPKTLEKPSSEVDEFTKFLDGEDYSDLLNSV
jgi:hypothetical protein